METYNLQSLINSGMSIIWLRKRNQILSWCCTLLAQILIVTVSVLQKGLKVYLCLSISGISSSKPFLICCLKHRSLVFWIDVGVQYNSGNMPANSPNSLSISSFAFIRLIENPAISSAVMKDPHITLATTIPRLSSCTGCTNQILIIYPRLGPQQRMCLGVYGG